MVALPIGRLHDNSGPKPHHGCRSRHVVHTSDRYVAIEFPVLHGDFISRTIESPVCQTIIERTSIAKITSESLLNCPYLLQHIVVQGIGSMILQYLSQIIINPFEQISIGLAVFAQGNFCAEIS